MNSIERAVVEKKAADAIGQAMIGTICAGIIHTAGAPPWLVAIYGLLAASYMLDIAITAARIRSGVYGSFPWERFEAEAQVVRLRRTRKPVIR